MIEKGTYIVYPQRHSSSMWMVEAKVEEVTEKERKSGRVVPALKVKPISATWTRVGAISTRLVTLTALDRVTVVPAPPQDNGVPDGYCGICHRFHFAEECHQNI